MSVRSPSSYCLHMPGCDSLKCLFQAEVMTLKFFCMVLMIYRTEMNALNLQAFVVRE